MCVLSAPWYVSAQTSPTPITPQGFGGTVIGAIPCTANGTLLVGVKDFRTKLPIQVHYIPFVTRLNLNYNIFTSGNGILGQYMPSPMPCLVGVCPFCKPFGTPIGIITSLPFAGVGSSAGPAFSPAI